MNSITNPSIKIIGNELTTRGQIDRRWAVSKIVALITSFARQFFYLRAVESYPQRPSPLHATWKKESDGLVVLLHGLNTSPAVWHAQRSLLDSHPNIDLFAPTIPHFGACSLEEATHPLLNSILNYTQTHPNKPVCLLGTSNGSRIATKLEVEMRQKAPKTPVLVSSVAGLHFGSKGMNLLKWLGIAKKLYPEAVQNEFTFANPTAAHLLEQIKSPLPPQCAERKYEFYASLDDVFIRELSSTLPVLNKGEQRYILTGESHYSIVAAVAKKQIETCVHWIGKNFK